MPQRELSQDRLKVRNLCNVVESLQLGGEFRVLAIYSLNPDGE